jgi:DNA-binding response OmpR family regulator
MKILIIDDSEMQQKIARIYLEKGSGHTIISASNGKTGFETAVLEHPELIVLDVEMPVMDGTETLKKLKSDPDTCDIPVIMCTSVDKPEVREHLLSLGAADYIKKPHGFSLLNNKIKDLGLTHK